ncbi:MAG: DUF4301 family protein [Prevotellaceae bacterium]|jgi:hypothetical protein|nr:DUF4301 family protein [Prevotellaceae bacterium]
MNLNDKDRQILLKKGIGEEQITEQLARFRSGFPFLRIEKTATAEDGIAQINTDDLNFYLQEWSEYLQLNTDVVKFVPASGAASRMFKDLFEFLDADYAEPQKPFEIKFFDEIRKFAFYQALNQACIKNTRKSIDELVAAKRHKEIVANLLQDCGLNYGFLPKGLLKFHAYKDSVRTPVEEHLVEGALYAKSESGKVNVHFTVSPEHRPFFEQLLAEKQAAYEKKYGVIYNVSFSEQKSSTDTIAADAANEPFRDSTGNLVFRPGGHGALIENLNDIAADIVFIKNIDNVVPDTLKDVTITYKKLLAGVLVNAQAFIFNYLNILESGNPTDDELNEIIDFLKTELNIIGIETESLEKTELIDYLYNKLNRPIRVCGMVKNEGEPGGGPFFAENEDGTVSLQILESSQIQDKALLQQSTHFNPVDLVCTLRNYKGEKFDLTDFVDKNTSFISLKSKNGKELKALELPGLWNGAMSDWNTIFVEVPIQTFNPVKTVNDLLRVEHQ